MRPLGGGGAQMSRSTPPRRARAPAIDLLPAPAGPMTSRGSSLEKFDRCGGSCFCACFSRGEGSLHRGSRGMSVRSTVGEQQPCGREVQLMRRSSLLLAGVVSGLLLSIGVVAASAGNGGSGNGAPSGTHYNLNLIGFAQGQTYPN